MLLFVLEEHPGRPTVDRTKEHSESRLVCKPMGSLDAAPQAESCAYVDMVSHWRLHALAGTTEQLSGGEGADERKVVTDGQKSC